MAVICERAHPAHKPARGCAPGRWRQWGAVTTPDQKGQGGRAPPDALERVGGEELASPGAVGYERPSLSLFEFLPAGAYSPAHVEGVKRRAEGWTRQPAQRRED